MRKKEFAGTKVWRPGEPRPVLWPGGFGEKTKLEPLGRWEGAGQGRAGRNLGASC